MRNRARRLIAVCGFLELAAWTGPVIVELPKVVTIVWAGKLLAIPGQAPLARQSIVIRHGIIKRIANDYLSPADIDAAPDTVETLDFSFFYFLPGLFDLHVHLTIEPGRSGSLDEVTRAPADLALTLARTRGSLHGLV